MRALLTAILLIAALAGVAEAACPDDLSERYYKANCQYLYPSNDGFLGKPRVITLKPGTIIDRYGSPSGYFLAPLNTSYDERALPYQPNTRVYCRYKVVHRVQVRAGETRPWFDQRGGGMQFMTINIRVEELVYAGYLRSVRPSARSC